MPMPKGAEAKKRVHLCSARGRTSPAKREVLVRKDGEKGKRRFHPNDLTLGQAPKREEASE